MVPGRMGHWAGKGRAVNPVRGAVVEKASLVGVQISTFKMRPCAALSVLVLAICGMLAAAQHGSSFHGKFNGAHGKLHRGLGKYHGGVVHSGFGKIHGGKIHGGKIHSGLGKFHVGRGLKNVGHGIRKHGFRHNIDYGFKLNNYKGIDYKYICKLQPEKGYGKFSYERYYYDTYTKTCEPFYYKGYGGNGNNFYSYKQCVKYCKY